MADIRLTDLAKSAAPAFGDDGAKLSSAVADTIRVALAGGQELSIPAFGTLAKPGATGKSDFVAGLSTKLGESNDPKVRSAVDAVFEAVKKELLTGKRVLVDGAGAFSVGIERPEIEQQPRGHRLIKPPGPAVFFESPEGKVQFSASDELKKRLESFKASSILLVLCVMILLARRRGRAATIKV